MNEPNPQSVKNECDCCGWDDCGHSHEPQCSALKPSPTVTEKVSLDRRKTLKEELKRHDRRLFYQADDHTYWDTERLRVVLRFRDKIHQKHREELEREKRALVKLLERCLGDLSYDLYVEAKWLLQKHQIRDNFQNR